jgi:hypothetical protein
VEAVAALSPDAQERLLEAIQSGLKRMPAAVERLKVNPDLSVQELLRPTVQGDAEQKTETSQKVQFELANLIQLCFPDMPRISAAALAAADVMGVARSVAEVHDELFRSDHLRTDFVMSYGLILQTLEQLEERIEEAPALQQAFD